MIARRLAVGRHRRQQAGLVHPRGDSGRDRCPAEAEIGHRVRDSGDQLVAVEQLLDGRAVDHTHPTMLFAAR
jgi:hypothetical protein